MKEYCSVATETATLRSSIVAWGEAESGRAIVLAQQSKKHKHPQPIGFICGSSEKIHHCSNILELLALNWELLGPPTWIESDKVFDWWLVREAGDFNYSRNM